MDNRNIMCIMSIFVDLILEIERVKISDIAFLEIVDRLAKCD